MYGSYTKAKNAKVNQTFTNEVKKEIAFYYNQGLKPAEIAITMNKSRGTDYIGQQISNQITNMHIREKTKQPREIYKDPQDHKFYASKVETLKSRTEIGDRIEVHLTKWDGSKSKAIKIFKVIGIYDHYVNVMIKGRVVSYYWDDIIKLYKAVHSGTS